MATAQTRFAAVHRVQPASSGTHLVQADLMCASAISNISDPHIFPPANSPCHKALYSLSSQPPIPPPSSSRSTRSRSRSRAISSPFSTSSFMSSPSFQSSSLWDEDSEGDDLLTSPIHPLDYLKTLLSQLGASISSLKTSHAHQQAAFNPFNTQCAGCGKSSGAVDVSATEKVMTERLERLSYLHMQLSKLPHLQPFAAEAEYEAKNETEGFAAETLPDGSEKSSMMLRRYEGIITRFHEEIEKKEAVTAALKETLARSMLRGEKLERRVKTLEAALLTLPACDRL